MDIDKETEEKKLRDLTPEKDAKGGGKEGLPLTYPPSYQKPTPPSPTDPPAIDPPPGARKTG